LDFHVRHMLAPDVHCKTFDQAADGYVTFGRLRRYRIETSLLTQ